MGIIQKQTIKGSIYSYLGVGIGYINVVVLMPQFFSTEQVGLTQLLLSLSAIFSLLGTFGFGGITNRLFPYFRNKNLGHNGFPVLLSITGVIGFFVIIAAFFILKPYLIKSGQGNSLLLIEYLYFLIPMIFFRIFFLLFDGYNKVLLDAVTGTFWMDFGYKALNLVFIILYTLELINFRQYMFGFTLAVCFPVFPVLFKLVRTKSFDLTPRFNLIDKQMLKQMMTIAIFSLMAASSGIIVLSIDRIMVNSYLALSATGIFSICALFGTIIKIPFTSLNKISTPFLAEAWKNIDLKKISALYEKSTINQLLFATLLFVGILGNLDNIFRILPPEYEQGRYVVVIYALAFLIMTSEGSGSLIIGTSSRYKVQTYFMFLTSFLTIILNILFIPLLGMNGAAIATLITYIISTVFRILYLKYKMKLFPYNYKHLLTLMFGLVSFVPVLLVGHIDSLILDIGIKSAIITIIFLTLTLWFNISDELSGILKKYTGLLQRYFIK